MKTLWLKWRHDFLAGVWLNMKRTMMSKGTLIKVEVSCILTQQYSAYLQDDQKSEESCSRSHLTFVLTWILAENELNAGCPLTCIPNFQYMNENALQSPCGSMHFGWSFWGTLTMPKVGEWSSTRGTRSRVRIQHLCTLTSFLNPCHMISILDIYC